jgi:peptide/nickel transport system substrate-binding protein
MSQFHADYTPLEKLEPLIKEKGFEPGEWWRLFWYMTDFNRQHETGMPSYTPWMLKSFSPTKAVLERNPYYFKVDAAGNQLPYIDYMEVNITSNTEASTVKVIAGEVDLVRRDVNAANLSLYKQYEKEKGYKVILLDMHASAAEVFLNLTNPDPVWRQVVRDVRFREALSLAIDRQQIIDAIYFGVAGPPRTIPRKEYDPEKANQLLDEMGLDKKDANGCRLGPDGNPFIVSFTNTSFTGEDPPTAEMVKKFWDAVGVCTTQKTLETNLWLTMAAANELKAFTWWAHYPRWPWHEANDYIGVAWQTTYAPLWVQWYRTNGQEGEKPPQEYIDLREMQNELFSTPDVNRQRELWEKMKKNIYDNIWWIPITDDIKLPLIVNAKLGNVPETGYHLEVATAAEMFFYKE